MGLCLFQKTPVQPTVVGQGRPKWAPEVKWATPITANMVKAMAKIMMPVSSPSREGTMGCVACELQHKNKCSVTHITDFSVFDNIFDTYVICANY